MKIKAAWVHTDNQHLMDVPLYLRKQNKNYLQMKSGQIIFKSHDGTEIFVYRWAPDNDKDIRAILQISHGMAEHAGRYAKFADFLTQNGFVVYANDHRGHGKTAGSIEKVGFFAPKNGWFIVTDDLVGLTRKIKQDHPGLPLFLLGHSMGSFLSRTLVIRYPNEINGLLLSGTGGSPGFMGKMGLSLTNFLLQIKEKTKPGKLLNDLTFGSYNNRFKPNKTFYDWLSRDPRVVDAYMDDPYCGGVFSIQFFKDLITGLFYINKLRNIQKMSKDLPVFIFSGTLDPVGGFTIGVNQVIDLFKKAGIKDLNYKLYKDGRHESLNELNKEEVYKDVLDWINQRIK